MSILLVDGKRDLSSLKDVFLQLDNNLEIEIWPNVEKPEHVQLAVAWNQPEHVFESYPNLKVISSLGAGVDHLLRDQTIPDDIIITKITDSSLVDQMQDYILATILSIFLRFQDYRSAESWNPQPKFTRDDLIIGILGLGNIGGQTAQFLSDHRFDVYGLSTSKKNLEGVQTYEKKHMDDFLNKINILVNLLPLTNETEGILNLELFKRLRNPSYLINTARGKHLVDEDLIYALDTGTLESAFLDVFPEEPLPDSHPFWSRKNIFITPHIASISKPENIAGEILENYKRLLSGMELQNVVNKEKGY